MRAYRLAGCSVEVRLTDGAKDPDLFKFPADQNEAQLAGQAHGQAKTLRSDCDVLHAMSFKVTMSMSPF